MAEPTAKWLKFTSQPKVEETSATYGNADPEQKVLDGVGEMLKIYKVLMGRQQTLFQQPESKSNNEIAYKILDNSYQEIKSIVQPSVTPKPETVEKAAAEAQPEVRAQI